MEGTSGRARILGGVGPWMACLFVGSYILAGGIAEAVRKGKPQGPELVGVYIHDCKEEPVSSFEKTLIVDAQRFLIRDVRVFRGGLIGRVVPRWDYPATASMNRCAPGDVRTDPDRDCGFTLVAAGSCAPGEAINIDGGANRQYCLGAPMLRVCADGPCEPSSKARLASASGKADGCPLVSFSCPASGRFVVLSAPRRAGDDARAFLVATGGPRLSMQRLDRFGIDFTGATIAAHHTCKETTSNVEVRIDAIREEDRTVNLRAPTYFDQAGWTWLYDVVVAASGETLCDAGESAIPLDVTYDRGGGVVANDARFSFACARSVAADCYRWGYRPWDDRRQPVDVMQRAHHACTRMARADYCGTGVPQTTLGTFITLHDDVEIADEKARNDFEAATRNGTPLEAVWDERGAVCMHHRRHTSMRPACEPRPCTGVEPVTRCAAAFKEAGARTDLLCNRSPADAK